MLQLDSIEEDLVRMATELTRQATQLHEVQLELQRLATTTSQAEERAKVAQEKACAAVTAIPGLLARLLLEWAAAFRDQPIVLSGVEACEATHGNPFDWNLKEVSEALGPLLHKVCKGSAGVKLKAVLKIDGLNAWRVLAF